METKYQKKPEPARSVWAGVLLGVGMMAAIDEIVFHQLLGWHHFYDLATPEIGLITDGLLHAAELMAIVAGFFMLADLRRKNALVSIRTWAGFFIGAGFFQVLDGIVNHKVLRLHQIRYNVDLLPYDLAWNIFGLALLITGLLLWLTARAREKRNGLATEDSEPV